jgi:hypothetical protein
VAWFFEHGDERSSLKFVAFLDELYNGWILERALHHGKAAELSLN